MREKHRNMLFFDIFLEKNYCVAPKPDVLKTPPNLHFV